MFSRIRCAAHVLSPQRVDPYVHADIAFEAEKPLEVSRASRLIGGLVEVIVISLAIGLFAVPPLSRLWPLRTVANAQHATAIIASILGISAMFFFEKLKAEVQKHLNIGERVAPYFGHRITEAYKILRG